MDLFFEVSDWKTDPINTEPEKCDDMRWFTLDSLPENIIPYIKIALQNVQHNIFYSELGWKA